MRNSTYVNNEITSTHSDDNVNSRSARISTITSHIPNSEFPNSLDTTITCTHNSECITRPEFTENIVFGSHTMPCDTMHDSRLAITAQEKGDADTDRLDSQMGCHSNQNFSEKPQTHDFIAVFADFPELELFECEYEHVPTTFNT